METRCQTKEVLRTARTFQTAFQVLSEFGEFESGVSKSEHRTSMLEERKSSEFRKQTGLVINLLLTVSCLMYRNPVRGISYLCHANRLANVHYRLTFWMAFRLMLRVLSGSQYVCDHYGCNTAQLIDRGRFIRNELNGFISFCLFTLNFAL